jgi:hypothetical protein
VRCRVCRRSAGFRARGKKANRAWHGDKEHDLCQRCYRDSLNRSHHPRRAELRPFPPLLELEAQLLSTSDQAA